MKLESQTRCQRCHLSEPHVCIMPVEFYASRRRDSLIPDQTDDAAKLAYKRALLAAPGKRRYRLGH